MSNTGLRWNRSRQKYQIMTNVVTPEMANGAHVLPRDHNHPPSVGPASQAPPV